MSNVVYVEVVAQDNGKFVYEARDSNHKVVEKSDKEYATAQAAAQAGSDAYSESHPDMATVRVHGKDTSEK